MSMEGATGFEPLVFGWALSEELVQWFRCAEFDAVREVVVRRAAAHCHRVWRRQVRPSDPETERRGRFTRPWLTSFFRHWLAAMLASESPRLAAALPVRYAYGEAPPSRAKGEGRAWQSSTGDALVYELYALTDEEIALVEQA